MSSHSTNSSRFSILMPQDTSKYNVLLIGIFICIAFLLIILFLFSKQFRVYRVTNNMNIYIKFQNMQSLKPAEVKNYRLADFYVCSSYNSALSGYQLLDYVSPDMVKKVLQCGCRYLEFQVFGNTFGTDSYPVVSSGFRTGEWKLSLNTVNLEDILKMISDTAFTIFDGTDGAPNNKDPLFISLDLKTNYNYMVNNKIQKLISKYLGEYLLNPTYNYQNKNIALEPIKNLLGKVIIFSSDGYQGSTLEEIINYSWNFAKLKKLHYTDIEQPTSTGIASSSTDTTATINAVQYSNMAKFNMNGLSIISPNKEGDILTHNFNPTNAWNLGCQFVSMNFQTIDTNMNTYIGKFKNKAFILKPKALRS